MCVSDVTENVTNQGDLSSRVKDAAAKDKTSLWKDTFLASEPLRVESPCPVGPRVSETTTMFESVFDLPLVSKPGPYVLYIFVANARLLATLERLNLGRIIPQEFVDPGPNQPAGYEQVAAALYLSREEFERADFLARQIAEALGCTEGCSGAAPQPQQETPGARENP